MSIFEKLDTLRSKPEPVRRRIVFLSAIGITSLILVGWLVYFTQSVPTILADGSETKEVVAPFSYIKKEISSALVLFSKGISAIGSELESEESSAVDNGYTEAVAETEQE